MSPEARPRQLTWPGLRWGHGFNQKVPGGSERQSAQSFLPVGYLSSPAPPENEPPPRCQITQQSANTRPLQPPSHWGRGRRESVREPRPGGEMQVSPAPPQSLELELILLRASDLMLNLFTRSLCCPHMAQE